MIAARRGYRHPDDDAETRTRRTRAFLCTVIPALVRMRPLIEAGIVVPLRLNRQSKGNRSALWEVKETSIELYAHVNLAPMLQLGLSHRELTVLHDKLIIEKRGY